ALPEPRAVDAVAVVPEHDRADDAPGVLRPHVELFAERGQRHLEVLDQRVRLVLVVEGVLVGVLHRVLGAVVDLAKRGREIRPLELGEGVRHQDRLHELLGHADIEEGALLLLLPQLDDAALLVEADVGQAADGDREGRVLALLGGHDHGVSHAHELLLDHPRRLRFRCHRPVYLRFRFLSAGPALTGGAGAALPRRRLGGPPFSGAASPSAGAVPSEGAASADLTAGRSGASPSVPSAVTMIEWGSPSGPPSWPRISSVRVP